MKQNDPQEWTNIIQPQSNLWELRLCELWQYRDLVCLFVQRNFISQYKQSILGPLWFFIQPLLTTLVFVVIFGKIAQIPTDGVPPVLFYLAGVTVWNYFAACFLGTADTFWANAYIFGKVYFPRLSVPLATVITGIGTFLIQMMTFIAFLLYFYWQGAPIHLGWQVLFLPVLLGEMAMLGMGMGLVISSLTAKYRDLKHLVTFGTQLWMYVTPIVYPMSLVPSHWQFWAMLNPMAAIVEFFRYAFLGQGICSGFYLGISFAATVLILMVGVVWFNLIERTFIDTI